jgi:hypothetical protein
MQIEGQMSGKEETEEKGKEGKRRIERAIRISFDMRSLIRCHGDDTCEHPSAQMQTAWTNFHLCLFAYG